jgi:PAS domain S-box-containing protein
VSRGADRSIELDDVPAAVCRVDAEFRVVTWNRASGHLLGYTEEEARGERLATLLGTTVAPEDVAAIRARVAAGQTVREVAAIRLKSGEERYCEFVNRPLVVEGRFAGGVIVMFDVTERVEAERLLAASEHQFRRFLMDIPMMATLTDPDGAVVFANRLLLDLAQREADETRRRRHRPARRRARADRAAEERHRMIGEILEAERARVAKALHDDTVQVLAASLFALDRVALGAVSGAERAVVETTRATLAEATERTRRLMFELRPALLEAIGLHGAIRSLCEHAAERGGFTVDVRAPSVRFPAGAEELCYRTVREAVMNAAAHSRAQTLTVQVGTPDGSLVGEVRDDGAGFDPSAPREPRAERLHLGMHVMAERVRLAGGELTVESAPGVGTAVRFRVPLGN